MKGRRKSARRKRKGKQPVVSYTLDRFKVSDLREWQRKSRAIEEYHLRVFHELEAQRQLYRGDLFNALKDAKRTALLSLDRWVRIVDHKYSTQPLSAVGSIKSIGGRFNIGENLARHAVPFHALYLAEDSTTAYCEYLGLDRDERRNKLSGFDLALVPGKSFACVHVSGTITNLLDITDPNRLQAFCDVFRNFRIDSKHKALLRGTSLPEMTIIRDPEVLMQTLLARSWRELGMQLGIPSNPQVFGRIAFEAGYDGILYDSTRGEGRCLCIFLENLTHSETVLRLPDPAPPDTITELSSETWRKLITSFSLVRAASRVLAALH